MKNGKARNIQVHDPGPMPLAKTFCVHCNASFPQAVPIIGSAKDAEYQGLMAALAIHVATKHPEHAQANVNAQVECALAFSAMQVLHNFQSTDEGLMGWRDRLRHKLFRFAMRGQVSDEMIQQKVEDLFALRNAESYESPSVADVILLIKSMRDALEERDLYPEESPKMVVSPV
jgi:hypothetical protein